MTAFYRRVESSTKILSSTLTRHVLYPSRNLLYQFPSLHPLYSYNAQAHKKYTLFCGTKVIQVKAVGSSDLVSAVVLRTGFSTAKGQLFNTILFPKPIKFKFYSDRCEMKKKKMIFFFFFFPMQTSYPLFSYKFLLIMTMFALIACAWAFYILKTHKHGWWDIISNSLDLITITVPPALPLVLTIGSFH